MSDPARNLSEAERREIDDLRRAYEQNQPLAQQRQEGLNNAYRSRLEAMPIAQFPPKPRPSFWRGFMDGLSLGPLRRLLARWIGRPD